MAISIRRWVKTASRRHYQGRFTRHGNSVRIVFDGIRISTRIQQVLQNVGIEQPVENEWLPEPLFAVGVRLELQKEPDHGGLIFRAREYQRMVRADSFGCVTCKLPVESSRPVRLGARARSEE